MTENEALKEAIAEYKENLRLEKLHLESHNFSAPLQNTIRENIRDIEWEIKWLEEIQQYRAIGTIEEFKALKEKSVAKKVEYFSETFQAYTCPSCETPINNGGMAKGVYCKWCGQKFDWSE